MILKSSGRLLKKEEERNKNTNIYILPIHLSYIFDIYEVKTKMVMVNVDGAEYLKAKEIINKDKIKYPTLKNYVDTALKNMNKKEKEAYRK